MSDNTVLYAALVGVVLYMVTQQGEKDKAKVMQNRADDIDKGANPAQARRNHPTEDDKITQEATIKDLEKFMQEKTFLVKYVDQNVVQASLKVLPRDTKDRILQLREVVKFYWGQYRKTGTDLDDQVERTTTEIFKAMEELLGVEQAFVGPREPPTNPLTDPIRTGFGKEGGFNAAPTPGQRDLSPEEAVELQRNIAASFVGEADPQAKITKNLKDATMVDLTGEGEPESLTNRKRDSSFVANDAPFNKAAENAQVRNDGNQTTSQSQGQAPRREGYTSQVPTGPTFNAAPGQVTSNDLPPAKKPKPQPSPAIPPSQQSDASIAQGFNASGDPTKPRPRPSPRVIRPPLNLSMGTESAESWADKLRQVSEAIEDRVNEAKRLTSKGETLEAQKDWAETQQMVSQLVDFGQYLYPQERYLFLAAFAPSKYNTTKKLGKNPYTTDQIKRIRDNPMYELWRNTYRTRSQQVSTFTKTRSAETTVEDLRAQSGGYGRNTRSRTRSVARGETVSGKKRRKGDS